MAERAVGKRYEGGEWRIDRAGFQAYAAATNDENPAYQGEDAVAPPMYHVRPILDLMMLFARDPELELDLLRLVHGEHAMRFHRPLREGDALQMHGTLESLEEKSSGRVATFGLFGSVNGDLALEGRTVYFIRGESAPGGSKAGEKKARPAPEPLPAPDLVVAQPASEDQATRYAAASGDRNPIHVDPETARAAGLPGVILHGLCTMAFAGRDIVRHLCGGDPTRLAALSVRFARPVFPGETLTLKVWEHEGLSFVTENAKGQAVIVNGRAEIR